MDNKYLSLADLTIDDDSWVWKDDMMVWSDREHPIVEAFTESNGEDCSND